MREPVWIEERDALALHDRMIAMFGGAAGLRERALLLSALARPQQILAYSDGAGIIELAAALISAIVRNHPFTDGNKRTGFVLGVLFLELNLYRFTASQEDAANAIMNLAAGTLDEIGLIAFIRENAESTLE